MTNRSESTRSRAQDAGGWTTPTGCAKKGAANHALPTCGIPPEGPGCGRLRTLDGGALRVIGSDRSKNGTTASRTDQRLGNEARGGRVMHLVDPDANHTERGLRGIAVGRKNHYGSRSQRGTEVAPSSTA
jgi:hypothetical protein